jgi:hypothetical protein
LNSGSNFGKVHIDVLQPRKACENGKGVHPSSVYAHSELHNTPCRSRPSKPSGSESQTIPAANVEEEAEPDKEVPLLDNDDEMVYP